MSKKSKPCFRCGESYGNRHTDLYGFNVCGRCKPKLGLLKDQTIKKHISSFEKAKKEFPDNPSFEQEISDRLIILDRDYIRKKIKLLHIQERLKQIE